ncbi:hypothetical protein QF042_000544 [Pedobacter sp. W3I1]|nr:hypothetical protein [Pedobacter sp. W3I1]
MGKFHIERAGMETSLALSVIKRSYGTKKYVNIFFYPSSVPMERLINLHIAALNSSKDSCT